MNNIFAQSENSWKISFQLQYKAISVFEDFLLLVADTYASSCINSDDIEIKDDDIWLIEAFFEGEPRQDIETHIERIANENNIEISGLLRTKIIDKDWVAEVQKNFPPFSVRRFFICNNAYDGPEINKPNTIKIDPNRAFGTGEHQTTKACILALEEMSNQQFGNILDMGCGTAILAIAAAKIWPSANIIGVDIDQVSVNIAQENAKNNTVAVDCACADGYAAKILDGQKFDLIISNILANPLIQQAPDLAHHLNKGGYAILSGFLDKHEKDIKSAFSKYGVEHVKSIAMDDWRAVILQKKGS